jgi:integrator complex subunit 1
VERLEGTMNILIIHAIVILLSSYAAHLQENPPGVIQSGKAKQQQKNKDLSIRFSELLDIWFPKVKENNPKGFLLNTSEEAVLFPDWVKLKMIRSNNPRLLEVATQDLEVDQLILFIQAFGIPVQTMTYVCFNL